MANIYSFTIDGRLDCLNDYLKAERVRIRTRTGKITTVGNNLKHKTQEYIIACIRRDLRKVHIDKPVSIYYCFYEPNKKRDLDNVMSFAMKTIQDSLVLSGVLNNDGWACIQGISADFRVDAKNPHIVVVLTELDDDLGINPYQE